jgi:hypothetical protein
LDSSFSGAPASPLYQPAHNLRQRDVCVAGDTGLPVLHLRRLRPLALLRLARLQVVRTRLGYHDPLTCTGTRHFEEGTQESSMVSFSLTFSVNDSPLHGPLVHRFFEMVAERQIEAFEQRARAVYAGQARLGP